MDIINNVFNEYKLPISLFTIAGCYGLYRFIKRKNIKNDIMVLNKLKNSINPNYNIIRQDYWKEPQNKRVYKYDIDELSINNLKNKYYNDTINYNQIRKHADYIISEIIKNEKITEKKLILCFNEVVFYFNIKNNTKDEYFVIEIINNIDLELKKINSINNEIIHKIRELT